MLTGAQPHPPRETPEPRLGMAGEEGNPAHRPGRAGGPAGGMAGTAVPTAFTQPCGHRPLQSPLQERPEPPGRIWDLATAFCPADWEALGAGSRQATGEGARGPGSQQSPAAMPAAPSVLTGAGGWRTGGAGTTAPPALPRADLFPASGHLAPKAAHVTLVSGHRFPPGLHERQGLCDQTACSGPVPVPTGRDQAQVPGRRFA